MNLHLCIPALFWPDNLQTDIYQHLELPALKTILAKSYLSEGSGHVVESWLCELFNIHKQCDWPVAPITLQQEKEYIERGEGYWLRVDPVHLRIENNHILLGDSHIFNISLKEAISFTNSINELISDDGFTLLPLHSDRWYLHCNSAPNLHTSLLSEVVGNNINNLLPLGNDRSIWNSKINEIQMLLYEHPLNQMRESRGELVVNSVWIWGGGVMPQKIYAPYTKVWSNHVFAQGLAKMSQLEFYNLPEDGNKLMLHSSDSGEQLIFLDNLQKYANYRDVFNWRNELVKMEQNWFVPLLQGLRKKQITQLRITVINEHLTKDFTLTPNSFWKFWAKVRPLKSYN
jgi:hypothetical protein